MPFTQYSNLDFDQIRESIKDYLRANSNFTDFDFEGSNFSILIDILAYNTYITAFNSNMIANESFLDSATMRENVVSLARNIGYVPRSRKCSKATVSFSVPFNGASQTLSLKAGLVCVGNYSNSSYVFSIPEDIEVQAPLVGGSGEGDGLRIADFTNVSVYEGTFLTKTFTVDSSIKQRFILENSFVDTSTIRVYVKSGSGQTGKGKEYFLVDNIVDVDSNSEIYLLQEIKDEKYELLFGDGYFGKKLPNGAIITINYIVTNGENGNGVSNFSFSGSFTSSNDSPINPDETIIVSTLSNSKEGSEIETVDSIKYFAPKSYSSQNRAVTTRDYETIIKKIYPDTEAVLVVGGEELVPPEFGSVNISIKPKNGTFLSDFTKQEVLSKLKNYSLAGINQKIIDLKILYVEIESSVYYNSSQSSTSDNLKSSVITALNNYASSSDLGRFGGRFKYSKLLQVIDNVDEAIMSNITKVKMRRDMKVSLNNFAQYELCFGNQFHINADGYNIKSTGFKIEGDPDTLYFTDVPNKITTGPNAGNLDGSGKGVLSVVKKSQDSIGTRVVVKSAGVINYITGEIILGTIKIRSTDIADGIIQIQAFPESNDVIGLKDLYLIFDVSSSVSSINMKKDTISSGESTSGTRFKSTSSYPNGKLTR
jgi:hypothetical protein